MNNKTKKVFGVLLLFICFYFSFILASNVLAAEETNTKARGPSVSPPIINLSLAPGSEVDSSFNYTNGSDSTQTIQLDLRPFVPSEGEHGAPIFYDNNDNPINSPLKNWITLTSDNYLVPKGETVKINFNINVPKNVEAKKYYVAIVAGEKTNETSVNQGSSVSTEIGVLVVADIQESAQNKINQMVKTYKSYPWYFYAMIIAFILAVIATIIIFKKKD